MYEKSLIFKKQFWKLLNHIDLLDSEYPLEDLKKELGVNESELLELINFTSELNYEIQIRDRDGVKFISPPVNRPQFSIDLNFCEWIAIQALFPKIEEENVRPYYEYAANAFSQAEDKYPGHELFKVLEEENVKVSAMASLDKEKVFFIRTIEEAAKRGQKIDVEIEGNKRFDCFPHKLVYIDGQLCLIGEEVNDRCLVYFAFSQVSNVKSTLEDGYVKNFSKVEVDDFIAAIRAISGKEKRLVMKVKSDIDIDLTPEFHFLGNPFLTTNANGDRIWAASVEVSRELYEWLYEIKDYIEIMDPGMIKDEFEEFCLDKSQQVYKKAS